MNETETETGAIERKRINELVEEGMDAATIWAAMEGDLV